MAGGVAGWIGTGSLRAYVICRTFSIAESCFFLAETFSAGSCVACSAALYALLPAARRVRPAPSPQRLELQP